MKDIFEPNCKFKPSTKTPTRIETRALRDIQPGEELTAYYGRDYDDSLVEGRSKVGKPRRKLHGVAMPGFQKKIIKNAVRKAVVLD